MAHQFDGTIVGVDLIGLAFDGYARPGSQSLAATALRRAGIAELDAPVPVVDSGDLRPARQAAERGRSGIFNEVGVIDIQEQLSDAVRRALADSRFPLVVGGDCSALLGAVARSP